MAILAVVNLGEGSMMFVFDTFFLTVEWITPNGGANHTKKWSGSHQKVEWITPKGGMDHTKMWSGSHQTVE